MLSPAPADLATLLFNYQSCANNNVNHAQDQKPTPRDTDISKQLHLITRGGSWPLYTALSCVQIDIPLARCARVHHSCAHSVKLKTKEPLSVNCRVTHAALPH